VLSGFRGEGTVNAVGYESDSHQLVETCLARLRLVAHLDDDPIVLPTIDLLPEIDVLSEESDVIEVDASELVIVCDSAKELPSAATIVRDSVKVNLQAQKDVPTLRGRKGAVDVPARKHTRWPVVLCALVATCFGAMAFIKSPLGAKPEVQHVVKGVVEATKSFVRL
jgi:hypothetical protein